MRTTRFRNTPAARVLALALALVVRPHAAPAQDVHTSSGNASHVVATSTMVREPSGKVTVQAMKLQTPLKFDGVLDDAIYRTMAPYTDFVQQEPNEGKLATDRTEAWIVFDETYVYVSARLFEVDRQHRVANDMRRDAQNLYNNDHFAVILDTFNDHRNGYGFSTNPLGALFDFVATNEQPSSNWNGLWESRTSNFEGGWSVEIRIPFRTLRIQPGGDTWGVNLRRMSRWKNETSFLSAVPRAWGRRALNKVSSAATLTGMVAPGAGLNLDVKPYVLGSQLTNRSAKPSVNNKRNGQFGGDMKWGIKPQLVADLTVHTDFAQVEDDDAQVNLTRFSLFFPEKREFFLEGQDAFAFGGVGGGSGAGPGGGFNSSGIHNTTDLSPILFYSRRIGLVSGTIAPIDGGARILGRSGGWQVGALGMRAAAVEAVREPRTDYSVLRVNRDVFSRSRIGFVATNTNPLADTGNTAAGVDAQFNLRDNLSISGYAARSRVRGITGDEASYRAKFDLNSDRYGLLMEHLYVGDGFNPGVGFLRRSAFRRSLALARLSPRPQNIPAVRRFTVQGSADYITAPNGRVQSEEFKGAFITELSNGDTFNAEILQAFERLDRPFTVARGVTIPVGRYRYHLMKGTYALGTQRPISGTVVLAHGSFYDGTLTEVTWRGRLDISPQLIAEPTMSFNHVAGPYGRGETNLLGSRVTFTVTPRMFVGALVQYQSRTQSVATNVRLRWEYQPGSELFVVYSDGRSTIAPGFPALDNRSVVIKVTKLFRW